MNNAFSKSKLVMVMLSKKKLKALQIWNEKQKSYLACTKMAKSTSALALSVTISAYVYLYDKRSATAGYSGRTLYPTPSTVG
jgi:hypothetical protein